MSKYVIDRSSSLFVSGIYNLLMPVCIRLESEATRGLGGVGVLNCTSKHHRPTSNEAI